jgi:hypothetical protein
VFESKFDSQLPHKPTVESDLNFSAIVFSVNFSLVVTNPIEDYFRGLPVRLQMNHSSTGLADCNGSNETYLNDSSDSNEDRTVNSLYQSVNYVRRILCVRFHVFRRYLCHRLFAF